MSIGQIGILAVIIVYLAAMVYVGFYFSKKGGDDSADGFYPGGHKLGALMTIMSAEASNMNSWLLTDFPGVAYLAGIVDAGRTAIGLTAGTYPNWPITVKCLRCYSVICSAITIPDFFSRCYHDEENILICTTAIVVLIFFIPYMISGLKAVGTLFNSLFGVNYHIVMVAGVVVIVGYTVLDGFTIVSTMDLIQNIVMGIALMIIVFFGISVAGGWEVVTNNTRSLTGYLNMTHIHNIQNHTSSPYGFITILSTPAWGLGYFGVPHILLRFMAISHKDKLKTSRCIASVWVVISMFVVTLIGVISYGASVTDSIPTFASSSELGTVIIRLASLFGRQGVLLSIVAGMVLAEILACAMSITGSQLLAATSDTSQSLLQDFLRIKMGSKTSVANAHLTVIAIALVGIALAWNPDSSVFTIVPFIWAGFGASFGPVMLFALFQKRNNPQDTLAGMIAGGVMALAWKYGVRPPGGAWGIYELLLALLVAYTAIVIVSLATGAPCKEICREFDSVDEQAAGRNVWFR